MILNSYRCIFVLMQISYSSAIPGRFSPQNLTWCCFNIITLRHLVIRYLITVLYLLYGSDFEKKIQEKVIKVIERHISSWSFMKHYIILYSKLKPSKDSIHLFVFVKLMNKDLEYHSHDRWLSSRNVDMHVMNGVSNRYLDYIM